MSKLSSLLKASMSGGLRLFNYRGKTEKSRRIMPIVLGLLIGSMMFLSAKALMIGLKEEGAEITILSTYTIVTALIILMEGSYKSVDLIFKPHDNDALLSMPIPRSTIILSRIIKFYLFEMVYCLIFLLPAIITYIIDVPVEPTFYLVAITMILMVPIVPIAISCMIGLIISAVSGRFKHKAFLQVVLSFVALFATAGLVLAINVSPDFNGPGFIVLSNKLTELCYSASTFASLTANFDILKYILYILVNLAVLLVTVFIISKFCFQIISRLSVINHTENTSTNYSFKNHSQTFAMVKKEITKYFNTPVLLMNTAIGLVFFIVAVGALCLKFDDVANSMISSVENFPLTIDELHSFLPGVNFAMVAFASLLTCITANMISLERRSINVLKSLPISGVKVMMTKVLAATLLIVPITGLGSLIMAVKFQFGIIETILVLIGVIVMPLVTELIGILINLKYPRFDADNDAVVVKQSASVMVATFLGLGMVLATISATFATVYFTNQIIGLMMIDLVYTVLTIILYAIIATKGEKRYLKLFT